MSGAVALSVDTYGMLETRTHSSTQPSGNCSACEEGMEPATTEHGSAARAASGLDLGETERVTAWLKGDLDWLQSVKERIERQTGRRRRCVIVDRDGRHALFCDPPPPAPEPRRPAFGCRRKALRADGGVRKARHCPAGSDAVLVKEYRYTA